MFLLINRKTKKKKTNWSTFHLCCLLIIDTTVYFTPLKSKQFEKIKNKLKYQTENMCFFLNLKFMFFIHFITIRKFLPFGQKWKYVDCFVVERISRVVFVYLCELKINCTIEYIICVQQIQSNGMMWRTRFYKKKFLWDTFDFIYIEIELEVNANDYVRSSERKK